jgi:hypothetical protein
VRFHYEQKALVTMTAVRPAGRFGELGLDGLTVQSFNEKPEQEIWLHQRRLHGARQIRARPPQW